MALRAWSLVLVVLMGCNGAIGDADDPDDVPPPLPPAPVEPLEPLVAGLRLMTPTQYDASVREVLRIEDDEAIELAIGEWGSSIAAARGGISADGVSRYETAALGVAEYVFADDVRRARLVDCEPSAECTETTVRDVGRRAYRRSLTADEVARWTAAAVDVQAIMDEGSPTADPFVGLQFAVAGILQSPGFLYRQEFGEPDGDRLAYTDVEMASRLAFLIWNQGPDEALIEVAESGELRTEAQLMAQVRVMLADPRAERGVRGFLAELLDADALPALEREAEVFPEFDAEMALAMRRQLVQTAVAAMARGGFPALFTSDAVWLDDELAPLYGREANVGPELVESPVDPARAGVLTTPGYLALHSYPGSTSPALRGLFVRTRLLCDEINPPPVDVDTEMPEPADGSPTTARDRAALHEVNQVCEGCHQLMDPIGLSLEEFDAIGRHRTTENGLDIDPSGELDGVAFDDARGLGQALATHPDLMPCMVATLYGYGAANTIDERDPGTERMSGSLVAPTLEEAILAIATDELFRYAHAEESE